MLLTSTRPCIRILLVLSLVGVSVLAQYCRKMVTTVIPNSPFYFPITEPLPSYTAAAATLSPYFDISHANTTSFSDVFRVTTVRHNGSTELTIFEDQAQIVSVADRSFLASSFEIPFSENYTNAQNGNHQTSGYLSIALARGSAIRFKSISRMFTTMVLIITVSICAVRKFNPWISEQAFTPIFRMVQLIRKLAGTIYTMVCNCHC